MERLLWIVDREAVDHGVVPAALRAGIGWIQLREPAYSPACWRSHLASWSEVGPRLDVVVNGGPRWALDAGLGAHLKAAQPSIDPAERNAWTLLGRSVHDAGETRRALADAPDYLVAGPVFPTTSKPGHPGIGPAGLATIVRAAGSLPVLAVGGVTPDRVKALAAAGAYGAAVRSGISAASDPARASGEYLESLRELPPDPA